MARKSYRPLYGKELEKIDQIKLEICNTLRRSMFRVEHCTSSKLAAMMGTSRACVSKVQCARTEELTLSQLFNYLVRMEPNFKMLISI